MCKGNQISIIGMWIVLFMMGSIVCYASSLPTVKTRSLDEWEQQFQRELDRLQRLNPTIFIERQFDTWEQTGPSQKDADIVLWAIEHVCANDLQCLYEEFPALSVIYQPIFWGDLDDDGKQELLCATDSVTDYTILFIYKNTEHGIAGYRHNFDWLHVNVSIRQKTIHEQHIIARKESKDCVRVENSQQKVTYKTVNEMELRFTGSEIKIVEPFQEIDRMIVLDNTECESRN